MTPTRPVSLSLSCLALIASACGDARDAGPPATSSGHLGPMTTATPAATRAGTAAGTAAPAPAPAVTTAAADTVEPGWARLGLDDPARVAALIDGKQGVVIGTFASHATDTPADASVTLGCARDDLAALTRTISMIAHDSSYELACKDGSDGVVCTAAPADEYNDSRTLALRRTRAGLRIESLETVTAGVIEQAREPMRHALRQTVAAARAHGCRGGRGLASVPATRPDVPLQVPVRTPVVIGHDSYVDRELHVRWAAPGQIVFVRARQHADSVTVAAEGRDAEAPVLTIPDADSPGFHAQVLPVGRRLILAASASGSGADPGWIAGWQLELDPSSHRPVVTAQFRADVGGEPPPAWLEPAR